MKIARRDLYLVAGLGMIVGSFFAAAKALGGVLAISYFVTSTDFSNTDPSIGQNLENTIMTSQISGMVHGIGSFLILFFGGRWMLRGPKLLDQWIECDRTQQEARDRQETAKVNKAWVGNPLPRRESEIEP